MDPRPLIYAGYLIGKLILLKGQQTNAELAEMSNALSEKEFVLAKQCLDDAQLSTEPVIEIILAIGHFQVAGTAAKAKLEAELKKDTHKQNRQEILKMYEVGIKSVSFITGIYARRGNAALAKENAKRWRELFGQYYLYALQASYSYLEHLEYGKELEATNKVLTSYDLAVIPPVDPEKYAYRWEEHEPITYWDGQNPFG